jgi:hypothetical protein
VARTWFLQHIRGDCRRQRVVSRSCSHPNGGPVARRWPRPPRARPMVRRTDPRSPTAPRGVGIRQPPYRQGTAEQRPGALPRTPHSGDERPSRARRRWTLLVVAVPGMLAVAKDRAVDVRPVRLVVSG